MTSRFLGVALAVGLLTMAAQGQPASGQARKDFRFRPEQSVYVVVLETTSRDLSRTKFNLEIERRAKEQFKKQDKFSVAPTLREADFVFLVVYDAGSYDVDELALAVLPSDYEEHSSDLDALRIAALWQGEEHFKRGRHAAAAGATIGLSLLFDKPSVVKGLVKKFHKEVFRKP